MPGGIPMKTASLNAVNKKKRKREKERHPSDLGNWRRDGRARTWAARGRISEAEDEEEEAAVGAIQRLWWPQTAAMVTISSSFFSAPSSRPQNPQNANLQLGDSEKKTKTTLRTKSRENTCGTKITIPNNAKNRRIGVWRIRAAASQRPQQLIRLRFLSKTGFPSVEWITIDYALLECALGSKANPGMPAHVFHNA